MKRYVALIIALSFLFSSIVPALALTETKISQEKAVEKIKSIFDTSKYDRFNIHYNESYENKKIWELSWSESTQPYGSLNASIDADTGNILYLNMYKGHDPDRQTLPIPKYNEGEARKIAEAFAKKLQPDEFAKTKLTDREYPVYPLRDTSYSDRYSFNFIRMENNIPVEDNGINIRVDAHTGEVESYSFTWSWEPLTPAENLISIEEAEKVFKDKEGLKLAYQRYYDYRTREENIKLVYTVGSPQIMIDAYTGELLKNEFGIYGRGAAAEESMKQMDNSGLTPVELEEVEITKNCISKETAIDIVKKHVTIPKGYEQRSANLYGDYSNPDEKVWNINWRKIDDENRESGTIYARVHAISSELLSFSINDYSNREKDFKQNYDRKAAQKKVEEFLKKIQSERLENVELEEIEDVEFPEKVQEHYFTYTRMVNNIPYTYNGFNITVDAQTGIIKSYRMQWQERDFPSPDGVLTRTDAETRFLEDIGLELVYVNTYNYKEQSSSYKLVYKLKPKTSYTFDAFNFNPLDYNGNPIKEEVPTSFIDIKDHWAESDIQLLIDLGIIVSSEDNFRPDEAITEGEFIKLLMIAKNQRISDDRPLPVTLESDDAETDEDIEKYIEAAQRLGWIKAGEAQANTPLPREKAAAFIIRAMGFEKVATLSDIFKEIVEDYDTIYPEYKGHVTIAIGLGLLSEDAGSFNPKNITSRAQAATIIVRMLKTDNNK